MNVIANAPIPIDILPQLQRVNSPCNLLMITKGTTVYFPCGNYAINEAYSNAKLVVVSGDELYTIRLTMLSDMSADVRACLNERKFGELICGAIRARFKQLDIQLTVIDVIDIDFLKQGIYVEK